MLNGEIHRARNEALLVGLRMEVFGLFNVRPRGNGDLRAESGFNYPHLAVLKRHGRRRFIGVRRDQDSLPRDDRQIAQ